MVQGEKEMNQIDFVFLIVIIGLGVALIFTGESDLEICGLILIGVVFVIGIVLTLPDEEIIREKD